MAIVLVAFCALLKASAQRPANPGRAHREATELLAALRGGDAVRLSRALPGDLAGRIVRDGRGVQSVLACLPGRGIGDHLAVARFLGAVLVADPTARQALAGMLRHECRAVAVGAVEALAGHVADAEVQHGLQLCVRDTSVAMDARAAACRLLFATRLELHARRDLLCAAIGESGLWPVARDETGRGLVAPREVVDAWLAAAQRDHPGRDRVASMLARWWPEPVDLLRPARHGPAIPAPSPRPEAAILEVLTECMPRTPALRRAFPQLARGITLRSDVEIAADLAARPDRYQWVGPRPANLPLPRAIAPGRRGRDGFVREFLHVLLAPRRGGESGCGPLGLTRAGRFSAIEQQGASILGALVRQLENPDLAERATLVEALAWTARRRPPFDDAPWASGAPLADPEAVMPHIVPFLDAEAPALRRAALRALEVIGEGYGAAVPKIVAALGDPAQCALALRALERLGPAGRAAVPRLRERLAAGQLDAFAPLVAVAPEDPETGRLLSGVWRRRPELRRAICTALGQTGAVVREVLPLMVVALDPVNRTALQPLDESSNLYAIAAMGTAARRAAPVFVERFDRVGVPTFLAQVAPERLVAMLRGRDLTDPLWSRLVEQEPRALAIVFDALPEEVRRTLEPRVARPRTTTRPAPLPARPAESDVASLLERLAEGALDAGPALAKLGPALRRHLPVLERIVRGRRPIIAKRIAIQLLGRLGPAARPVLQSIDPEDVLHPEAAAALERIR